MTLHRTIAIWSAACLSISASVCADGGFFLKQDATGKVFGPFRYDNGATVELGSATFTIQKDEPVGERLLPARTIPPELHKVNMVGISPFEKDGVLIVSVLYKNRDDDTVVLWDNGEVTIQSTIYETDVHGNRGRRLLTDAKTVTRARQNVYIDLPKGMTRYGLIECTIDTGIRVLTTTDTFLVH